jgi:3-oxoadipate enol-lactonase
MKVKANGISIHYEIQGRGANLVLIHGMGDNLSMWYHQVPVFSKHYQVVTYDTRGAGETEIPEGEYSLSVLTEDAYQLMKAIGVKKAFFLGYSMGGRIALELAIKRPEIVKAIILSSSPIFVTPPSPQNVPRRPPMPMPDLLSKGGLEAFAEMHATSAFSPGFKSKNPSEFDRYMKIKLLNKPESLSRLMRSMGGLGSPPDLGNVKCPVLIIAGEFDSLISLESVKQLQKYLAGSKLITLPAGHAAAVEQPDQFNSAVLDFLSEVNKRE